MGSSIKIVAVGLACLCALAPAAFAVDCWGNCGFLGQFSTDPCKCTGSCGDPKPCCEFWEESCSMPSCKGYCDGPGSQGFTCYCDDQCTSFNDCCDDYVEACLSSCGDPNGDGLIQVTDIISVVTIILEGDGVNTPLEFLVADVNSDELINVNDIILLTSCIITEDGCPCDE